jgi:hypothetical protein
MKIKALSSSYRSLQYLADWMQVGTSPIRWASVKRSQHGSVGYLGKMRITLLDYIDKRPLVVSYINTFDHLKEALATEPENSIPTRPRTDTQCLKLFVVEDLSRMVIEMLGTRFGIDPLFFREQIGIQIGKECEIRGPHCLISRPIQSVVSGSGYSMSDYATTVRLLLLI